MSANPDRMLTAILIVAPHPVQEIAAPLRRLYSPDSVVRVPPHITVLFPFVPFEQLDEASQTVQGICATIAPFDITMQGYGRFPLVAFMQPTDSEPIKAVIRRIFAAFPEYPPYEGAFGDDLHPHMTVGEFANEAEQEAAILPDYEAITFRAERLHILYGFFQPVLTWITHSVIPLKG